MQAPYTYAATLVQDKGCAEIGLWLEENAFEYPLWILLNEVGTDSVRVEHVRVSNESSKASLHGGENNFVPCALVVVAKAERPSQITEADKTYSKIWSIEGIKRTRYKTVAVYELEKDRP